MLYVKSRKSFDVRRQKKNYFPVCQNNTHGKVAVCHKKAHSKVMLYHMPKKSTRQTTTLPCALVLPCVFLSTLGKTHVCRVPVNLHNRGAHSKHQVSGSVCHY